jgi:hypothetical protein
MYGLHQAGLQEFVGTNKILVRRKFHTRMEEVVADRIVIASGLGDRHDR